MAKDELDQFLAQSAKDWVEEELGPPRKTSEHKDPLPQCSICGKGLTATRVPHRMPDGSPVFVCNGPRCIAKVLQKRAAQIHQQLAPLAPDIGPRADDIIVDGEEV